MAETKYYTFKLDEYVRYLAPPVSTVLAEIAANPDGVTFNEITERTHVGPHQLKTVLATLYDRDYIINSTQADKIRQRVGILTERLRKPVFAGTKPHYASGFSRN